jgi:hypothetical protein
VDAAATANAALSRFVLVLWVPFMIVVSLSLVGATSPVGAAARRGRSHRYEVWPSARGHFLRNLSLVDGIVVRPNQP